MKVKQLYGILIYSCLLFPFTSCTKDELTKPAPVSLQMEMAQEKVTFQEQEKKTYIRIEKATYHFSGLAFEGYRQVGNDYFFSREFEDALLVNVEEGKDAELLEFDMPQGEYDQVKISLHIQRISANGPANEKGKNKEEGSLNKEGAIVMEGFYTNTHQQEVPLLFVYDFDETFEYTAGQGRGGNPISVDKTHQNKAIIRFDAVYWMQLINGRMLQSAKLTKVEGTPTIIISADRNEHIFNLLTSRIQNASELSFK